MDFTEEEREFDGDNLFIILKYLDYARLRDETWITKVVFPVFSNPESNNMSWASLKLLLCGIEGIFLTSKFAIQNLQAPYGRIRDHGAFTKLHLFLQHVVHIG